MPRALKPRPSREEQKAATRVALLEAARKCYRRRGYVATSIADIVAEAKVAHGTFYVHFSSQQAVFDELLEVFHQEMVVQLAPLFARATERGLDQVVAEVAHVFLTQLKKHRDLVHAFVERSYQLQLTHLKDGFNQPVHQLLRHGLEQLAQARGVRRPPDLDLLAGGILGMWFRLSLQYLFGEADRRQQVSDTLVLLTRGALGEALPVSPRRRAR